MKQVDTKKAKALFEAMSDEDKHGARVLANAFKLGGECYIPENLPIKFKVVMPYCMKKDSLNFR